MKWVQLHPRAHLEQLGFLPEFLDEDDPRPAAEQFHANYGHGGGWNPMPGFSVITRNGGMASIKNPPLLKYPGDPPLVPLFLTKLRDEVIVVYDRSFVLIVRKDGTWEAARMD